MNGCSIHLICEHIDFNFTLMYIWKHIMISIFPTVFVRKNLNLSSSTAMSKVADRVIVKIILFDMIYSFPCVVIQWWLTGKREGYNNGNGEWVQHINFSITALVAVVYQEQGDNYPGPMFYYIHIFSQDCLFMTCFILFILLSRKKIICNLQRK